MKIKNISCTQFAGIRDCNVSFADGINVIYGKNETGKSTLVNLLSRTLFQNARLDRRSDKDFYDLYFPSAKKGSTATGDFADGRITFETENGTYTLSKEWGSDSRCTLSTPDGVIRDRGTIDEILAEVLLYGEGVYSDMLFSSQRNTDTSLKTILDSSKKTEAKQEIADAVSLAFAESDGISVDAIEQAINAKIEEIAGKHWDFDREAPVRRGTRWSNGLGEILKAYYAMEDAKAILEEISRLESDADRTAKEYTDADNAARIAEEEYRSFRNFESLLAVKSERQKSADRIEKELARVNEVLKCWPDFARLLEAALTLKAEKENREIFDKYECAKKITDEINSVATDNLNCPDDSEITQVRTAQHSLSMLENKLCGMNLTAAVNMLGANKLTVTSLLTGKNVDISDGTANITEAVKITVPDILEIQLSPADVDIEDIGKKIDEQQETINRIFEKYRVESITELENLAKSITTAKAKIDAGRNKLSLCLGTVTFKELEEAAKSITGQLRSKEEIDNDISALCASDDISKFITAKETILYSYTAEYGSINELNKKASGLEEELRKAKESLSSADDIPDKYASISEPEAYLDELENKLKLKQELRETALNLKTAAASKAESYKENLQSDPVEDAEKAERIYKEQKALLRHWMHIAEVFRTQKESLGNNPMQDIADSFERYLGIITDGKVESEFPESDKLNMNIYSGKKLLDYGKLSEGTRETVSLAFRLAVLDHLFPEGGGVIVLDDPLADMDAERCAQSCKLIKECAKRHQVIFLSCREEYLEMLGGNKIVL